MAVEPAPKGASAKRRTSKLAKAGLLLWAVGNILAARELVPGWGMNLGLSHTVLYAIAVGSGAVGGAMMGGRYALPCGIGGALAGFGSLRTVSAYLASVNVSYSAVTAVIALAGALPGIAIAGLLVWGQRWLVGNNQKTPES